MIELVAATDYTRAMPALAIAYHRGGVHLPNLSLWLDPPTPQLGPDKVFVSHAHSDHIAAHREVILSEVTSRLMRARLSGERLEHVLPFHQPTAFAGQEVPCQLTLLPAGHILGSAMAYLEAEGESLLYTGDFKLRPGLSAEPCEPRPADVLIMETTFGRPEYRFPPTPDVLQGVIRFCREALDNDETPVLLGYSLGKSQEMLRGLANAGLPIMLHEQVDQLTRIYEESGRRFPAYEKYDPASAAGRVLLCPPNALSAALRQNLGPVRTAILTGWAVDPSCRYRYQTDAAFPLSDHADFPDLIEMVKRVSPKKVYTLHGFAADFAQTLRELGFEAQALSEEEQLGLPLGELSLRTNVQSSKPRWSVVSSQLSVAGTADQRPLTTDHGPLTTDYELLTTDHRPQTTDPSALRPPPSALTEPSFAEFAATCSRIAATTKKLEKIQLLAGYCRTLDASALAPTAVWFAGHPFSPSQNKSLQLGWALIRDAFCAVAGLDQAQFGQIYLKHSDLGEAASEILQQHGASTGTLSIAAVEALFSQLQAARGPLAKLPLLIRALRQCTALEGKYLVKILTGDLRIGLKEGLVEEAVGLAFNKPLAKIKTANLLLGNIGETAQLARRGELSSARLTPFRPVKYMLASAEETAGDVWKRMHIRSGPTHLSTGSNETSSSQTPAGQTKEKGAPPETGVHPATAGAVWLEDKYDGIRSQLHKVGARVALYSRDLKEITPTFLELADAARSLAGDFVLDGEILAMRGGQALPFSDLQKRLGRREGDLFLGAEIPVQFVAFDLLWQDGESCLDRPLRERRTALESLAAWASPFRLSQITQAHSAPEIEAAWAGARHRGHEGLMIKDPASAYTPGRRGLAWLKLKKACATLDCVVVGAEYGHGKRKAVLSDYTFAVRDDVSGQLKTIGRAYTGLTDAEIAGLTRHFLGKAVRQEGRYFEVQPDTVLEIAFDLIQPSDRHTSGLALRFPRIVRIRTDKTPAEIDTVATAQRLVQNDSKAK